MTFSKFFKPYTQESEIITGIVEALWVCLFAVIFSTIVALAVEALR